MNVIPTPLPDVLVIEPSRFTDDRGWFQELWNRERYRAAGLDLELVQTNVSSSSRGVLRGMHFQTPHEQGKLISVLEGSVFDVVVDVRRGSPSFARWFGAELSMDNRRQLWVPEGFAHGFLVTSERAIVHYGCTRPYVASADRVLAWNDPQVAIDWPFQPVVLSEKDAAAPMLADIVADLPVYSP